jgi:hypothetical protein
MRELRVQSRGNPLRIFYAFDPRRSAILLIGGDKTDRFYERYVPLADQLYDDYLDELRAEGLMSGRHKFSELEAAMTPARRARVREIAEKRPGPDRPLAQGVSQPFPLFASLCRSGAAG